MLITTHFCFSGPFKFTKLPSLKTGKLAEFTSHLKSRSLSDLFKPFKNKRQSKKREIFNNGKIDEKYFPLFRNLGLLFDNLLNESGDSYELGKKKRKRPKDGSDNGRGVICSCAVKSDSEPGETISHKKAIVPTKAVSTEFPFPFEKPTTAPTTTDPALGNFGNIGQNKDLPVLLPRDSFSSRGDNNGYSERNSPAYHRSTERDIARNLRNRKHSSRNREYQFSTGYDEEDTDSYSRNDASRDESRRGRGRGDSDIPYKRSSTSESTIFPKSKTANVNLRGHVYKLSRETKLKTRRNETEDEEFIPKHIRRIRGPLSENKISDITESIQSEEDNEKGDFSVPLDDSSDKRLTDRSGASSGEDKEVRPKDERVISIDDLNNLNLALQNTPTVKAPSVSIIDGYSVARDKNGQNKFSEQSIRVHV